MRRLFVLLALPLLGASPWVPGRVDKAMAGTRYLLLVEDAGGTVQLGSLDPEEGRLPCSTFKLPHALIALRAGAIELGRDELTCQPTECHRDHGRIGLAEAIRESCLSYFRQVSRRLGTDAEKQGLRELGYPATGEPEPLDAFWVRGPSFRITPRQQLGWIRRFYSEGLGVRKEHLAFVREATRRSAGRGWTLWGKTGSTGRRKDGTPFGWFMGRVQWEDGRTSCLVALLEAPLGRPLGLEAQRRLERILSEASGP